MHVTKNARIENVMEIGRLCSLSHRKMDPINAAPPHGSLYMKGPHVCVVQNTLQPAGASDVVVQSSLRLVTSRCI